MFTESRDRKRRLDAVVPFYAMEASVRFSRFPLQLLIREFKLKQKFEMEGYGMLGYQKSCNRACVLPEKIDGNPYSDSLDSRGE